MNPGGPAFPHSGSADCIPGMSLRDYFAAKFFAAMLANPFTAQGLADKPQETIERRLSELAYGMADALLAEREKPSS